MAYSATVTITRKGNLYRVLIVETEVATASEATIDLGIQLGTVVAGAWDFTSGSGSDATAVLGTASDPNSGTELVCQGLRTASGAANRLAGSGGSATGEGDWPAAFYSADGKLYHRSQPGSDTDNAFTTEYLIKAGW